MRNLNEPERGPLDWLRERRDREGNPMISDEEFSAGERLRKDFLRAHLQPRLTTSWSGVPNDRRRRAAPGADGEVAATSAEAQARVRRALAAVGTEHANILLDVCCLEAGLGHVERKAGWPQRSGKIVLQMALRELARHYGYLGAQDRDALERSVTRRWGAAGYRGSVEQWGRSDGSESD